MTHLLTRAEHVALRIICAAAILFIGFAHRPLALAQEPGPQRPGIPADYGDYALPDGSFASLCITATDDTGSDDNRSDHHHGLFDKGCEACRISASSLLPEPGGLPDPLFRSHASTTQPMPEQIDYRRPFSPNTGPRPPPSLLIEA